MSDKQKDKAQYTRKKIQVYSYGLHDEIGKGYSSKVYKGRNDDTNVPVAVKVIDLKQLKNQINRTLLDSEIEILKQLKDIPNILSLHDVFTTKNNTYLVTELCHTDLSKRIKQPLSQAQAFHFMQQVLSGYIQFQSKGIVHRDLKPANLLMTQDGVVKIADFGFGIKTSQLGKANRYNVGSPLYMAPESLRKNDYSFKSDIWALGVIFYELLLNDTPWRAKSQKELLKRIETEPIQSIIANKNIPAIAKEFLVKTLKTDKNRRMSPEQIEAFSFESGPSILAEKNLNCSAKSLTFQANSPPCKLKSRADKSIEKQLTSGPSKPKSYLKPLVPNESVNLFQLDPTRSIQSPCATNEERTARINTMRSDAASKQNRKLISKILITEVHFCRFLFKLIQKMKQSSKIGLLGQINTEVYNNLMKSYSGIIRFKIEQLNNFGINNFINCDGYEDYKMTSDYDKLMKIAKEYNDRYRVELQKYWSSEYHLSSEPTNTLIKSLYDTLLQESDNLGDPKTQITTLSKDIVVLDYLITAHQLIEMVRNNPNGYQRFARKSRIQEIVEGRTVQIHWDLFEQIMDRVRQIMHKKQFISFGLEQPDHQVVMVA